MATLSELFDLYTDGTLMKKVASALVIEAQNIMDRTSPIATPAEKAYAAKVFAAPLEEAHRVIKSVLAANKNASVSTILNASDSAIQANVADAVALFVDADAGV